ncbi:DNA-directed DNA polymerase eta rad30 [Podospora pseudopauciseta]|uniref:DNA polymerase eta n=1 Tax=Podospora pseudopauciseta TaxID=2093780 RepID=A0ABR0I277_9PEZI|nr:DNA-directed DNA polymerase eta rad30 [Podospora pseudopauciseta]
MSSSSFRNRHRDSSPAGAPGRKRSQFTYRHFNQMASYNTSCPLRVVAHLDLDCFYAQVEMVRLGIPEDKPLAVQQWERQGLIAVNYPARAFKIGRHCTVTEARRLCPELIAQHVATWREGDDKWAYREDAAEHIATDKVSLDPYRLESRRIMRVIKEHLPGGGLQKVEKASIDEVFLDLTAHVHQVMLERYGEELGGPPPYGDVSEELPMPAVTALDWKADALVDLGEGDRQEGEFDDPDWDDVALLVASEIVRNVRGVIREKLGYSCSAGVSRNKLLSKLGSAHKKPNQQTVIRNRAVGHFLSGFKFTKIRNLGGKLGEQVADAFKTEAVSDLLTVPIEQLRQKLGDENGVWIYETLRGIDTSEVNSGTQIKSMLSAKSFRPDITTVEQATKWLRIFAADIFARLVEEGVLEHKRRPKTINLHHRHGNQTRSRSGPIPARLLNEESLFELAKNLFHQITLEGDTWPCSNLSLSVAGFEEGVSGNMGIDSFLVKGDEARVLKSSESARTSSSKEALDTSTRQQPAAKRRRIDGAGGGIQRFLTTKREPSQDTRTTAPEDDLVRRNSGEAKLGTSKTYVASGMGWPGEPLPEEAQADSRRSPITPHACSRCDANLGGPEELQSHLDWHFAKDLQEEEEERVSQAFANRQASTAVNNARAGSQKGAAAASSASASGSNKSTGRSKKKPERGQSKLNFG